MNTILISVVLLGVLGIAIGLLLGVAGKFFAVEVDERVDQVRECLPGNNCGGCGYAGCDAVAAAIVNGEAEITVCPVCRKDRGYSRCRGRSWRENGSQSALRRDM